MNKEKSIVELKKMCKKYNITGYSKLNKSDLIKIINKKMKGGEFDEKYAKVANNFRNNTHNIYSRKNYFTSPYFFVALEEDNEDLFNEKSNKFYKNEKDMNNNNFRGWKDEITVNCRLPNGDLIEKTGKIHGQYNSSHGGYIIIYSK